MSWEGCELSLMRIVVKRQHDSSSSCDQKNPKSDPYFFKEGENLWDVITLVSLSLLLSKSCQETGSRDVHPPSLLTVSFLLTLYRYTI